MHDQLKYGDELRAMGLHQLSLLSPLVEIIEEEVIRHQAAQKATISRQLTFDYADTFDMKDAGAMIRSLTEAVHYQSEYGKEILIVAFLSWTLKYESEGEQKEIIYTCVVKLIEAATYLFKQQYGGVQSYNLDVRAEVRPEKILELIRNVHETLNAQQHN